MAEKKNTKTLALVFVFLAALWTLFILSNSLMGADASQQQSRSVQETVEKVLDSVKIEYDKASLGLIIRKAAHVTEFFIQAVLLSVTAYLLNKSFRESAVYILFICLVTAVTDEFIQLFSDGRGSAVSDVLIDFAGALTGFLITNAVVYGVCALRKRRKSTKV